MTLTKCANPIVECNNGMKPGQHLRAELLRLGFDQVAASIAIRVSRQSINNIINGRQAISRAMAGKLGRLTGRTSDYWLAQSFGRKGARKMVPRSKQKGVLVNHEIIRAIVDGLMVVDPFDRKNVQTASLHLTVGDVLSNDGIIRIGRDGFELKPGKSVKVRTEERIHLPLDFFCRTAPTRQFASAAGVTSLGFQIGPGFKGKLEFFVMNLGATSVQLRPGVSIAALEIWRL